MARWKSLAKHAQLRSHQRTPTIMKVQVANGVVTPIEYMPITTATGKPVTELPNIAVYDVQFWDATGTTKLDYNPNGLDTEGLVRTSNREFWVADEYSPSLAHGFEGLSITKDGKTIFFVLQSPLIAPDKKFGDRSHTTRIIKFYVASAKVTDEYAYTQEITATFNPREKISRPI